MDEKTQSIIFIIAGAFMVLVGVLRAGTGEAGFLSIATLIIGAALIVKGVLGRKKIAK